MTGSEHHANTPTSKWTQWIDALERQGKSPWPGPRPLHPDERLYGRHHDIREFLSSVLRYPAVILSGKSGVGKSSLMNAGLIPALKGNGNKIFPCNAWGHPLGEEFNASSSIDRADRFIVGGIKRASSDNSSLETLGNGESLRQHLDEKHGRNAVVILDQFEELIRYDTARFLDVCEWIEYANRNHQFHIVLALRTEYEHELRPLTRALRANSIGRIDLKPIHDPEIISQITSNPQPPRGTTIRISPDAARNLLHHWNRLIEKHARDLRFGLSFGLLDVQATLFALYHRARERGGNKEVEITPDDIGRLGGDGNVFAVGLREAAIIKLRHCEEAASRIGLDGFFVRGTLSATIRAVPQLSSAGYKVQVERWELVQRIISREASVLGGAVGHPFIDAKEVYESMTDSSSGEPRTLVAQAPEVAMPDTDRVTAGALLGAPPSVVLREEVRRAVFAIDWLEQADLIRLTSLSDNRVMLSLIHDGFSEPLKHWAESIPADLSHTVHDITASKGASYEWGRVDGQVLPNLRWRDSRVTAKFSDVVFVNCDFGGSRFFRSEFRGVSFVNCVLDGVTFEECTIEGKAPEPTASYKETLAPSFWVEHHDRDLAVSIAAYARFSSSPWKDKVSSRAHSLLSDASGDPALPVAKTRDTVREHAGFFATFERPEGGLQILGGRIVDLMFYGCSTAQEGIALHHVAGASLDIVEPIGGSMSIHGAAIRGVAVSRDTTGLTAADTNRGRFDLMVTASNVFGAFFDDGLTGKVRFTDSTVRMLVNAKIGEGFSVELSNCLYHDLLNVDINWDGITDAEESLPDDVVKGAPRRPASAVGLLEEDPERRARVYGPLEAEDLSKQLHRLAYRRHPQEAERAERLKDSG